MCGLVVVPLAISCAIAHKLSWRAVDAEKSVGKLAIFCTVSPSVVLERTIKIIQYHSNQ